MFDFKEEIIKYCRSDVDILRKCCMEFREMLREITDIDPFEKCLTIASYCHEVYRTNFLKKDTIAVFQREHELKMKQSNMAVKWLSYEMERNDIHIEHTLGMAGRNVSGSIHWMDTVKSTTRPTSSRGVFGMVSPVKLVNYIRKKYLIYVFSQVVPSVIPEKR